MFLILPFHVYFATMSGLLQRLSIRTSASALLLARFVDRISKPLLMVCVTFSSSSIHTCEFLTLNLLLLFLALSEPIDVYSEWVDACEAVAKRLEAGENPEEGPDEYGEEAC